LTAAAGLFLEWLAVKASEERARLSNIGQQRQGRYDSRLQCHSALMSVLRIAQHHPAAIEAYVVASIDREGFAGARALSEQKSDQRRKPGARLRRGGLDDAVCQGWHDEHGPRSSAFRRPKLVILHEVDDCGDWYIKMSADRGRRPTWIQSIGGSRHCYVVDIPQRGFLEVFE